MTYLHVNAQQKLINNATLTCAGFFLDVQRRLSSLCNTLSLRSGRCVCVSTASRGRSEIQNKQKQMCFWK